MTYSLRGLSLGGLACQVLNLKFSHFRKVNMIGKFTQMHTLNLDFSASLTTLGKDCFTCMPNLKCLSLCGTKISNLWSTSASLAKLRSLIELRFQSCLCCDDSKVCPRSFGAKSDVSTSYNLIHETTEEPMDISSNVEDELFNVYQIGNFNPVHETVSESDESTDSEVDFSNTHPRINLLEDFTYGSSVWNGLLDLPNEVSIILSGELLCFFLVRAKAIAVESLVVCFGNFKQQCPNHVIMLFFLSELI